jgi:uncharacterized protein DUF3618
MAETSRELRAQIAETRARIGDTIVALERRVDPRRVIDEHPLTLVGVAFGTGFLLSTTGATSRAVSEVRTQVREGAGHINSGAGEAFDRILNAVVGGATATLTSKANELLQTLLGASVKKNTHISASGRAA